MSLFNGGLIKPDGYSAQYISFQPYPCLSHDTYTPLCGDCRYMEVSHTITLGENVLALIIDRNDNSLIDYVTVDTFWETAQALAHSGTVIISESAWNMEDKPKALIALMEEAELYADCFGG